MNERIKQLYEQAGMKFLLGSVESFDIINFNPEKFAKSIVQEVIDEVVTFIRQNPGYIDEYGLVTTVVPKFIDFLKGQE
jgi:hypothetical protein